MGSKNTPLEEALDQLKNAIESYNVDDDALGLKFLALSKAFEVAVEYAWKILKRRVEDEGLDAPSPKEAVRKAARLGLIKDPEAWFDYITTRNNSVHDYFGISQEKFVQIIQSFSKDAGVLLPKKRKK